MSLGGEGRICGDVASKIQQMVSSLLPHSLTLIEMLRVMSFLLKLHEPHSHN